MVAPREVIGSYIADVAEHLPPKGRADIACELHALLTDDLRGRSQRARRPADETMARELITDFGRPDDVAARYRPAGLTIIPPEQSGVFLRVAMIGVAMQWAIGIAAALARIKAGAPVPTALSEWLVSWGIGALWWPGLMLVCAAAAAWLARRRWPHSAADGSITGSHRVNWIIASIGLPLAALCTLFYAAPGWFVGHIAPAEFDMTWATYTEEFRAVRLPALLVAMMGNLVVMAVITIKGHESRAVRRLGIGLGLGGIAIMTWCVVGGATFVLEPVDKIARLVLALFVFFALIDLAKRVARELIFSRR
jgi:hypothetical protein